MTKKLRKVGIRHKKYKEIVVNKRVNAKVGPVQYTRRLKTKRHKKIKIIGSNTPRNNFNKPPSSDEFIPSSFKEMLLLKEGKLKSNLDPAVGDIEGMTRKTEKIPLPKQGKYESDEHYIGRVNKEVDDELNRIKFAKKQNTQLIVNEVRKSKKSRKALKRLNEKRKLKLLYRMEKNLTGFEHLQDKIQFNEVVQSPPELTTKPKMVLGKKLNRVHTVDKLLTT